MRVDEVLSADLATREILLLGSGVAVIVAFVIALIAAATTAIVL